MSYDFHPVPPPIQTFHPTPPPVPQLPPPGHSKALLGALIALGAVCAVLIVTCCWLITRSNPSPAQTTVTPSRATNEPRTPHPSYLAIEEKAAAKRNAGEQAAVNKAELNELNVSAEGVSDLNVFSLQVGQVGTLPRDVTFTVAQVIDDKAMHVIPSETRTKLKFNGLKQHQTFHEFSGQRFLVRNVPTTGIADNSPFHSDLIFKVVGTDSYVDVTGARRTIFALQSSGKRPTSKAPVAALEESREFPGYFVETGETGIPIKPPGSRGLFGSDEAAAPPRETPKSPRVDTASEPASVLGAEQAKQSEAERKEALLEKERMAKFQADKARRDANEAHVAASRAEVARKVKAHEDKIAAADLAEAKKMKLKDPRLLSPQQRQFMNEQLKKEKAQKAEAAAALRKERAAAAKEKSTEP